MKTTLLAVVFLLAMPPAAVWGHRDASSLGLPPGAQLQATVKIPADPGLKAVVYLLSGENLAVVDSRNGSDRLIWSTHLPGTNPSIRAPGTPHVFAATVTLPTGGDELAAYAVKGGKVLSAIAGHKSGTLVGDEGINWRQSGFVVLKHDPAHAGSVPYRLRSRYVWKTSAYSKDRVTRVPDLSTGAYPTPNAVIHTKSGSIILLKLEVAADEASRQYGLMNRASLDADSGMVFVWNGEVHESFWMENTLIPLTVAFLAPDGTIQETQDMQPLTLTYHTPRLYYLYAVEVNQGYFQQYGIGAGDRLLLHF